jgi:hypothetical protein
MCSPTALASAAPEPRFKACQVIATAAPPLARPGSPLLSLHSAPPATMISDIPMAAAAAGSPLRLGAPPRGPPPRPPPLERPPTPPPPPDAFLLAGAAVRLPSVEAGRPPAPSRNPFLDAGRLPRAPWADSVIIGMGAVVRRTPSADGSRAGRTPSIDAGRVARELSDRAGAHVARALGRQLWMAPQHTACLCRSQLACSRSHGTRCLCRRGGGGCSAPDLPDVLS